MPYAKDGDDMIEELSEGLFLIKAVETPKIWRATNPEGKDIIEFEAWVSTEDIDRDGEILRMDAWRKQSLQNTKFLLFHDYDDFPLGKPYWTRQKDDADAKKKGLFTKGRFGPQSWGLAVGELYLQGDMDSFSVGFNWYKRTFDSEADGIKKPYFEYLDLELYEFSAVNIAANPKATIAMARTLITNEPKDIKDMQAIIKSIVKQSNEKPIINRETYRIKEDQEIKAMIKQFGDMNKNMLDLMAKLENKHADINASDSLDIDESDDDDIDSDEIGIEVDASGDDGDTSGDVEVLVGTGDDADEIEIGIEIQQKEINKNGS